MALFIQIIIFVCVIVLVVNVVDIVSSNENKRLEDRIKGLQNGNIKSEREKLEEISLLDRLTKVVQKQLSSLVREKTSSGSVGKLQAKIMKAGLAEKTDVNAIRAQRVIYAAFFGFGVLAIFKDPLYALAGIGIGAYFPDIRLDSLIKDRQILMRDEIPDFLDLLAATFPGSKGFEDAINRICKRLDSAIAKEFSVYVDEINAGKKKKEALRALGDRCNIKEIDMLINQIIQSEALGTGLEDTLTSQAKKLRLLKKTQAEIKAKKASATMLFSVLFSITSILIIVGGPALLQIMEAMG